MCFRRLICQGLLEKASVRCEQLEQSITKFLVCSYSEWNGRCSSCPQGIDGPHQGYYGGSSVVQPPSTHTGLQTHMHHHPDTHMHHHPDTGYGTPHGSMSGLLTPDLDLPLDFDALDDLPSTDGLRGFPAPSHPPSAVTPHTHHYTQQQQHHPTQPPLQAAHHPQGVCVCVFVHLF